MDFGKIDPSEALREAVLSRMVENLQRHGLLLEPRYPDNKPELIEMLSERGMFYNHMVSPFTRLEPTERKVLADLADSLRDAEGADQKFLAVESLRNALQAFGFDGEWLLKALPVKNRPEYKTDIRLPEGGPPQYGKPLPHNFRESACRFYSTTEGEPQGDQGSFVE